MSLIGIHWRTLVSIRFLFSKFRYRRSQRTPSIRDLAAWNLIFVQIARPGGDLRSRLWTDGEALIAACCVYMNYAANRFTSRRGRDGTRAPPATAAISDLLFCHSTPQIAWNANFITLPLSRRYDVQIALTPSGFRASNSRQLESPLIVDLIAGMHLASSVLIDYFKLRIRTAISTISYRVRRALHLVKL